MNKRFRLITNIAAAVLALFFLLLASMLFRQIYEDLRGYPVDEEQLLFSIEDGRYSDLVRDCRKIEASDQKTTKTMEECCAVADYFETALDYQIALMNNDETTAEKLKKKLSDLAGDMGTLSYAKDEIDSLLENRDN